MCLFVGIVGFLIHIIEQPIRAVWQKREKETKAETLTRNGGTTMLNLELFNRKLSTIDTLIPRTYTVEEVFGIPSKIELQGYEPGHPMVPAKTKGYVWNVSMVRDAVEWLIEDNPDPVWLSGDTGSGKTEFWRNLFAGLGIPTVIMSATSTTEPDDFIEKMMLVDGNTMYVPSNLLDAYSKGYAIVFDEIDGYPPEVMMAAHRILERGVLTLNSGKVVFPAAKVYMAATANTRGDGQGSDVYASTNIFNLASLNRFEKWTMTYPTPDVEIQILKNEFAGKLDDGIISAMVQTAGDIRLAYKQGNCPGPISIRDMLRWGRKIGQSWNRKDVIPIYHAFDKSFGNGVETHVRQMLHTLLQTRFGVKAPSIDGLTP